MITDLLSNLQDIHSEVMTKLIPENIREDVTILNVTGTLQEGDPHVVFYSSVEEMNQHTDLDEGMYAVVAGTNFEGIYKLVNSAWVIVGDPVEALAAFSELSDVVGEDIEYEGLGGTEEEIVEILEEVIGEEET